MYYITPNTLSVVITIAAATMYAATTIIDTLVSFSGFLRNAFINRE